MQTCYLVNKQRAQSSLQQVPWAVLTLGRASEGAVSCGRALDCWWLAGSVHAGADEDEEGGDDEDGCWCRWWHLWVLCRWRFSKLGVSSSLKECDRDTSGGADVEEMGGATLLLLFRAARWERTFSDRWTEHSGQHRSVCMQLAQTNTGASW